MNLRTYPKDFFPAILAEGFIQRIKFRLEHDKLRLSNHSLRRMFGKISASEKKRAIEMLKDIPLLQFAYHVLRHKAKIKKEMVWKDDAYIEKLVDKVAGIPYGNRTFLSISLIKGKDDDLMLSMRVFRGDVDKAYPTRLGLIVPAYLATDIRNALDRLSARHKGKLAAVREEATKKYSSNSHTRRSSKVESNHAKQSGTEQDES